MGNGLYGGWSYGNVARRTASALALAAVGSLLGAGVATAQAPDTDVLLDQEVTFRVGPVSARMLDRIGLREAGGGDAVPGTAVVGKPLFDKEKASRVTINACAVVDYYTLVWSRSLEDAERLAARTIRRVERTGNSRHLGRVDTGLEQFFGPSYGAGTRLDDDDVFATFPPPLQPGDDLIPYRQSIAGDDGLWRDHMDGDQRAYPQLAANPEWQRFHHRIDPETGVPAAESILRGRQYRRVLMNRRNRRVVTFFPDLPNRADLSDGGLKPDTQYERDLPRRLRRALATIPSADLVTLRLRRPNDTFTTREIDTVPLYRGHETRGRFDGKSRPRIINVTPPNGETGVDVTTDWEDPDDVRVVPVPNRRPFRVRLRFAAPLDPRTVDATNFELFAWPVPQPGQNNAEQLVPTTVELRQSRLGNVEVVLTPQAPLGELREFEVRVAPQIQSLAGERLNQIYVTQFSAR